MAQCVIYTRVSTRQQAWGHGLIRQLETCLNKAKTDNAYVVGVFTDICSGAGHLPQRQTAIQVASDHGCPIYVEAMDRWSRKGPSDLIAYGNVVSCSGWDAQFAETIRGLCDDFVSKTKEATDGR